MKEKGRMYTNEQVSERVSAMMVLVFKMFVFLFFSFSLFVIFPFSFFLLGVVVHAYLLGVKKCPSLASLSLYYIIFLLLF